MLKHSPVEHILFSLKICLADSLMIHWKINKYFQKRMKFCSSINMILQKSIRKYTQRIRSILGNFTPLMKELLARIAVVVVSKPNVLDQKLTIKNNIWIVWILNIYTFTYINAFPSTLARKWNILLQLAKTYRSRVNFMYFGIIFRNIDLTHMPLTYLFLLYCLSSFRCLRNELQCSEMVPYLSQ